MSVDWQMSFCSSKILMLCSHFKQVRCKGGNLIEQCCNVIYSVVPQGMDNGTTDGIGTMQQFSAHEATSAIYMHSAKHLAGEIEEILHNLASVEVVRTGRHYLTRQCLPQ